MAAGKRGEKVLHLGARLKYPITITNLYKKPGDKLVRGEPVLQYSYTWTTELYNKKTGQDEPTEVTNVADWSAPEDGQLLAWHVRDGIRIAADQPCITVEEACTHEIQFQGLCALCGKDMNEVTWANEHRDTERAPINMTHDQTSLTVSEVAAARAERELQDRLLAQRKLSLVVDLDQTIIHACIDPTIGEWQRDQANPNHEAVKDVQSFQLEDGPRLLGNGCWYYIKLRPGLVHFLSKVAEMYELHVYTMGTRAYAMNIAKIVDPEQKLFGNRVISRDENGSLTAKSLQRLFPVSTNMVVIIDDRADVWPRNRHNLIKVNPYDFYKGIGDINSSFLPKRQDILPGPPPPPPQTGGGAAAASQKPAAPNGGASGSTKKSALEEMADMGNGENSALLKQQLEEQERSLEKQLTDRPLLQLQEQLDKEDEEATQDSGRSNDQETGALQHPRHHLLLDDDRELLYLEQHLTRLHQSYFDEFESRRSQSAAADGGLDGRAQVSSIPDVGGVLDGLKAGVLQGTTVVLSGIVPLGVDVARSEIGFQLQSFGAQLQTKVAKNVTHLVISSDRPRTQKVRQAARIPSIKIVNQNWLADCLSQWKHLDETPYLIEIHPADRVKLSTAATPNETTDAETISDADTDDNPARRNGATSLRIVVSRPPGTQGGDDEVDVNDWEGDEGAADIDDADDMSPIEELKTFDWGSADDELAEFLAEDDGDDGDGEEDEKGEDTDMEDSTDMVSSKRKYDEDEGSEADSSREEGTLTKKQRLAKEHGVSSLRAEVPVDDSGSLPTPQITGDEEDVMLLKTTTNQDAVDDIDEDEFEADLLAELEKDEAAMAENG